MAPQTDSPESRPVRQKLFDSVATGLIWLFVGAALASACFTYWMGPHGTKAYHVWSYDNMESTWGASSWLGVNLLKSPADLWMYQETLYETKPDVLIEAGTYRGGSAYYFATLFDMMKHGRVLTIDITDFPGKPKHDRVTFLLGSSTSPEIVNAVRAAIQPGERVMVVLDSDHHMAHVLNELRLYSGLVTAGNYLVVEDTNVNGHPVYPGFGPGPMEAVREFLRENRHFVSDRTRERYGASFFPEGWLKRLP